MNMPRFGAEASLYKTSGHYRTGRQAINSRTKMIGPIHLAVINDPGPGETVVIVEKWPPDAWDPLEPWTGGQTTGPGTSGPGGGGTGSETGGETGGGTGSADPMKNLDEPKLNGCSIRQLNSKAAKPCNKQIEDDLLNGVKNSHYFQCTGSRKGKVVHPKMECCKDSGDVTVCDLLN
jgi:hypothetical protein